MREHLKGHGLTYLQHLTINWCYCGLALKAAFYTFGHGLTPAISGFRGSELIDQLWSLGRQQSIEDLEHRLNSGYYSSRQMAIDDYRSYAELYSEEPVMRLFGKRIERADFFGD